MSQQHANPGSGQNLAIGAILTVAGLFGLLWSAGVAAAWLSGHPVPHGHAVGAFTAVAHPGNPSAAWHAPVGPPVLYWAVLVMFLVVLATLVFLGWLAWRVIEAREKADPTRLPGLATRREVVVAAGEKALLRKAATLRPSLPERPSPCEVGYGLGTSRGVTCWAAVEDSMVLLGPPRSGKGLHVVIPMILDAPGAVITTSTRPDNLAVTMQARAAGGRPVAVFDPQRLAPGVVSATRWSPVRGCENPQVAMTRARALTADPAGGVENATFWSQQCYTAVRCLLHAAALGHRQPVELFHWSLSPIAAGDAVTILKSPSAAPAWSAALDAILSADPRTRDSTWAMVANTFAALADPAALDAVSPSEREHFDPQRFLRERGTLYLLGTSTGASATAGLVAAFIEDVAEAARRLAAASPGARLDPPLALVLDEGANYPIPSLPALMSEGGGTGITTVAVLQSLAQARSKWGQQDAEAIWDSAIVKIVMGGSGNADDLRDLSALIGTREERQVNTSWGYDGKQSFSLSTHDKPILEPGQLRTLRFGNAVLLLRSAPPILMSLRAWTKRKDADELAASCAELEAAIRTTATTPPRTAPRSGA